MSNICCHIIKHAKANKDRFKEHLMLTPYVFCLIFPLRTPGMTPKRTQTIKILKNIHYLGSDLLIFFFVKKIKNTSHICIDTQYGRLS